MRPTGVNLGGQTYMPAGWLTAKLNPGMALTASVTFDKSGYDLGKELQVFEVQVNDGTGPTVLSCPKVPVQ